MTKTLQATFYKLPTCDGGGRRIAIERDGQTVATLDHPAGKPFERLAEATRRCAEAGFVVEGEWAAHGTEPYTWTANVSAPAAEGPINGTDAEIYVLDHVARYSRIPGHITELTDRDRGAVTSLMARGAIATESSEVRDLFEDVWGVQVAQLGWAMLANHWGTKHTHTAVVDQAHAVAYALVLLNREESGPRNIAETRLPSPRGSVAVRYLGGKDETPTVSVAGNRACERRFDSLPAAIAWMNEHVANGGLVFDYELITA